MARGPRREADAERLFATLQPAQPGNDSASAIPHQVSGGQLQRAMAAMAMGCRPDIIVLDEPTTALDVTTQIEVLALIKRRSSATIRHGRPLHHPRPRRGGADRATGSWCCATARWSRRADPADPGRAARRTTPGRWSTCARAELHKDASTRRRIAACRGQGRRARLWRTVHVAAGHLDLDSSPRRDARGRRQIRLRQDDARARRRSACCRRWSGDDPAARASAAGRLKDRTQGPCCAACR